MKAKYYSKKSIYCNMFCPYRSECSNAVCPIIMLKEKQREQ